MNIPRSYRRLLITYPRAWRKAYGDIALTALLDVHAATGQVRPSSADRMRFYAAGISKRTARQRRHILPPLIVPGHRFDQTNGMIVEREQTAAELEHTRWHDQESAPATLRWGWRMVDPTRSRSSSRRTARPAGADGPDAVG